MTPDDPAAFYGRFTGRAHPQPAPVTDGVRELCEIGEERVLGRTVYTLTPRRHASGWHVLYTWGGGFVHPLRTLHWDILSALARHTGAAIHVPLYPLAPEHQYLEAFGLLEQVYRGLLRRVPAGRIVLCGDSSGGNLALGQALHYRDGGLPAPGLLVLFSPVLDATMSNPEMAVIQDRDPVLRISTAQRYCRWWAGTADLRTPLLSPVRADLRGLPPMEVFVGTDEILLPDVRLLRERVTEAGGRIRLHETPGATHGFIAAASAPEAARVYRQVARTLDELGGTPGAHPPGDAEPVRQAELHAGEARDRADGRGGRTGGCALAAPPREGMPSSREHARSGTAGPGWIEARAGPGAGVHALGVGAVLFIVTASVNLQVPLYPAYAAAAGLGTGPTALMFGAYVGGLLPVLLGLGGASDRLGRRPVLAVGVALASLATLLVMLRPEFNTLVAARLLQGMGMGLSAGTGTAYLAELPGMGTPERAAARAAVTTSLGSGGGALFTAAALLAGPTLRPASYPAMLAALVACLGLLWMMPTERRAAGDARDRAPILRLPSYPVGSVIPGLAIAAAWAVTGLVFVVVAAQLARAGMGAWSAPALFLVNASGALCQPWARRMGARRALRTGLLVLPAGYALLVAGTALGHVPLLLAGAAVSGSACYGFTFLGGLAEATRLGGANRARAVAGFLLCAYLGFSLAPAAVGFLADGIGVVPALVAFGATLLLVHAALAAGHARAGA